MLLPCKLPPAQKVLMELTLADALRTLAAQNPVPSAHRAHARPSKSCIGKSHVFRGFALHRSVADADSASQHGDIHLNRCVEPRTLNTVYASDAKELLLNLFHHM